LLTRETLGAPHQAGMANDVDSEDRPQFSVLTCQETSPAFYSET
jgi:hypothetical protein